MKTKDLIVQLQKLVEKHEPHVDIMGEHEIVVDVFGKNDSNVFHYLGFSPNIIIERTSDGVYDIISSFASSQDENPLHG